MRKLLLASLLLGSLYAVSAHAQLVGTDTVPGSSCAGFPDGATRVTADADLNGADVVLVCDGTNWLIAPGAAAGADREIQFNSASVLFSSSGLRFTSTGMLALSGQGVEVSNSAARILLTDNYASATGLLAAHNAQPYIRHMVIGRNANNYMAIGELDTTADLFKGIINLGGYNTYIGQTYDINSPASAQASGIGFGDNRIYFYPVSTNRVFSVDASNLPSGAVVHNYNSYWADLALARQRGTEASPSTVLTGDTVGKLSFWARTNTNFREGAAIQGTVDTGTIAGATTIPTKLSFLTSPGGAASLTERVTILGNGFVGIGDTSPDTSFDIAGSISFDTDISPASISANQNDYAPTNHATASVLRLTASSAYNITGLAGGVDGRVLTIVNTGTNAITLVDEDPASTAANRFALAGNVALSQDQSAVLLYDSTSNRWRVMATYGGGGGTLDALVDAATDYSTDFNLYLGQGAGANSVSGAVYNIAIGQNALDAPGRTSSSDYNIAIGHNALGSLTTGGANIAIGEGVGRNLTTEGDNVLIGGAAPNANTGQAYRNVMIGFYTGQTSGVGGHNVFVGERAGRDSAGWSNTMIGRAAGQNLGAGDGNVILGHQSESAILTSGSNNILIGNTVDTSAATASNELNIGNAIYGRSLYGATALIGINDPTPSVALDVNGAVAFSNDISPASIGANQNDYAPTGHSTASAMRLTAGAAYNITGLAGGVDGRVLTIMNVGTNTVTLKAEDAGSTAANRFDIGSDIAIAADQAAVLMYDSTSSRWRAMARPGGASGFDSQIFTASGTWTKPAGVNVCDIELWGAGGGGGGVGSASGNRAGGGGGGAYLKVSTLASNLSSTETVTVGIGGTAGAATGTSGGAGGSTSFGSYLVYGGGGGSGRTLGGGDAGGGGGGGTLGAGQTLIQNTTGPGAGGAPYASGGYGEFGGGRGGPDVGNDSFGYPSVYGGGGGGAFEDSATDNGNGGNSVYGGGGGGAPGFAASRSGGTSLYGGAGGASGSNSAGVAGSAPGGGGGGASNTASTGRAGGAGARGEVRVRCW